jgi:sucrose synthase
MDKELSSLIDDPEIPYLNDFLFSLVESDANIILRNEILQAFRKFQEDNPAMPVMSSAGRFLSKFQEILHLGSRLLILYRRRRADIRIYALDKNATLLKQMSVERFLEIKERLIKPDLSRFQRTMELNFGPFYGYGPQLKDPETIGDGIRHLNRYMSASLSQQPRIWNSTLYEFLKLHHLHGVQLLLDRRIVRNTGELENSIEDAVEYLERCKSAANMHKVKAKLGSFGFLDGWGDSVSRILETFNLLQDILEQPNRDTLEELLARIPMVSKVVLISPHGWFGQNNVLGRPDTGGQVVYVLDQARALENYLAEDLRKSGLSIDPIILIITRLIPENEGTTSDQPLEKVEGGKNIWILRVPFRDDNGEVVPQWISRFRIWPYLDQFAADAEKEIRQELKGLPDLIVGNYSDGNLVATQLSKNMGVIQCNIAHALEKSKYLFSDLYWQDFEDEYHFSIQFMADLLSMNLANFIITSTRQEITGTDESIGQYESYQFFPMPGLMRVVNGIDLFHPRFNVIPPGVSEDIFFPFTETERRPEEQIAEVERLLFEIEDDDCLGHLDNPDLPPIFSIARLDRIKNLTGLMEAYARSPELRKQANIIIIASVIDPARSQDREESAEIQRMHDIINEHNLQGHVRWIGKFLGKAESGEAYRIIADRQGIFVQPALFEAFGLTILEAMHSGLPVFATQFGGPLEIIEDKKNGFWINPTDQQAMVAGISSFLSKCAADEECWPGLSQAAIVRAKERFTWGRHCRMLTRLTKVYGFWRYSISNQAKSRLAQYCHVLYHLYFKQRAGAIER